MRDFVYGDRYRVKFDNNTHVRNILESMDVVLQPPGRETGQSFTARIRWGIFSARTTL